jgi:NAD(P)-dependent dehydrogenase (short-subunit alcohol dehydrogenase family)
MFQGKPEEEHYEQRQQFRSLKRQKMAESVRQQRYLAETQLRKGRVERLQKLKEEAKEEEMTKVMALLVPDGHVDTTCSGASTVKLLQNGNVDDIGDRMSIEDVDEEESNEMKEDGVTLPKLRSCYVCKIRFRELHHFYDQLCPTCAPFNWEKRHQTADLTNRVAIVTGARVKIGYQTCLKLLRAGATVVATTRFPNAAVNVYRHEPDFDQWKNRLQVYGLDLRDITGLEAFTRFLKMRFTNGIDILINNACQTVRRPRAYYLPLVEQEQTLWREGGLIHESVLAGCADFERLRHCLLNEQKMMHGQGKNGLSSLPDSNTPLLPMVVAASGNDSQLVAQARDGSSPFESTGLSHSAAMSQMIILPEDVGVSDSILPPGVSDINGQQLDLRTTNSWLLKMEEVSTPEILECMFVNAVAPFVLNSRLKPLMATPADDSRPDRFIINVSAMEGKFYRYKLPNHPHTNMAKAALNMLTRTSAEDLATKHRIYMNSVDTGWINDENPLERASKTAKTNLFQTPIDEIDAAARILDPIFKGVNDGRKSEKGHGKFLKDYRETEW